MQEGLNKPVDDGIHEQRARAIGILEAAHSFPGPFSFTVITVAREGVTAEIRALVEQEGFSFADEDLVVTSSKGGKYVSHRLRLHVPHAHGVLAFYERLRAVEGLVQLL